MHHGRVARKDIRSYNLLAAQDFYPVNVGMLIKLWKYPSLVDISTYAHASRVRTAPSLMYIYAQLTSIDMSPFDLVQWLYGCYKLYSQLLSSIESLFGAET